MSKGGVRDLFRNIKRVLAVAWSTDKKIFLVLCFLVVIGAAFPIVLSYIFKLVLDKIIDVKSTIQTISVGLISLFAFRYIIDFIMDLKSVFHYEYIEKNVPYGYSSF